MDTTSRTYRLVCFDLDGTLLPMDIDEFMQGYFFTIVRFAAQRGFDADAFMRALKAGIKAMATHEGAATNEEAFWAAFGEVYGEGAEEVRAVIGDYYNGDFAKIGEGSEPNAPAVRAIETLKRKDHVVFERITSYENSKSVKPRQTYYAENLAAAHVAGSDVLMVGNNTMEDLAFLDLGADAFLVTDCLLNPIDMDLDEVRHGTMEDFARWVEALPDCADPVRTVDEGPIGKDAMESAFAANAVGDIDRAASGAAAAAVAKNAVDEHASGKVAYAGHAAAKAGKDGAGAEAAGAADTAGEVR